VPTAAEAGYPGFELEAWVALFAPAGTPPEVIAKLTAAARDALASPEVVEKIRAHRDDDALPPPAELDAVVRADLAYWSKVITDARSRPTERAASGEKGARVERRAGARARATRDGQLPQERRRQRVASAARFSRAAICRSIAWRSSRRRVPGRSTACA
jgi:hypothetical protein